MSDYEERLMEALEPFTGCELTPDTLADALVAVEDVLQRHGPVDEFHELSVRVNGDSVDVCIAPRRVKVDWRAVARALSKDASE